MRRENDPFHRTEFTGLSYKNEKVFTEGKNGYKNKTNNPYPKYSHENRADWFVGFLYQQRITHRDETSKMKAQS